jgi:hypothetical protein
MNDLNKPPVATVVIEKYIEPEPLPEDLGVNAGLGVLTGTHVTGQPEILPEPEPELMTCPKVRSPRPYLIILKTLQSKEH